MNRFISVWISTISIKVAVEALFAITAVLVLFMITEDVLFVPFGAILVLVGIMAYNRSCNSGVDLSLIRNPVSMENRFLSFQISAGMDRKEYVDSYFIAAFSLLPIFFLLIAVLMGGWFDDIISILGSSLAVTALLLLLMSIIIFCNILGMHGQQSSIACMFAIVMFLLLFFGIVIGLILILNAIFESVVISMISGPLGTLILHSKSVEHIVLADI